MGKFHPHGDMAVYDSLVRMAQDFSLRYPLIKGQGNFGSLDGDNAAAQRYCVTGDTLVLTDKGLLPIAEISQNEEKKIDLGILNYAGKKKKAIKFFNSGKHNIIKITTEQGYTIKGTHNHPLLCWGVDEFGHPSLVWKLMSEINTGDYAIINRGSSLFSEINPSLASFHPPLLPKERKISLPTEMTGSLAFLLGALVSEGSFHQKKILFNNKDPVFYEEVKNSIYQNFPQVTLYERDIAGNCKELDLYHQQVVRFLENLGLKNSKAHQKEIPSIIFQCKKEIIRRFFQALFEGDGSVTFKEDKRHGGKSIQLCYDSKSKKLIDQMKILLSNFGIVTSNPVIDRRSDCYKMYLLGISSTAAFQNEIGFFSARKEKILSSIEKINTLRMGKTDFIPYLNEYLRKNYKKSKILKNNFDRYNLLKKNYPLLIKIITPADRKMIDWLREKKFFFSKIKTRELLSEEVVYSLKVDSPCHSFIANGFINHNTEAKLTSFSEELLKDLEKNTVNFRDNFDGSLKEPEVLPSVVPNLLVNGSSGIAVGMTTNIPPHNLKEVCDAIIALINNPEMILEELIKIIPGPDFPTGAEVFCGQGLRNAYAKGKGKVILKSVVVTEKNKLIVKEIPYQVNKAELIEHIADLVREKRILGIRNINDESDREGIRIVIELKQDADANIVLNQLYQYSRLQESFGLILLALVNNQPKLLGLKEILQHHIQHRKEVITRRTEHELEQAQQRVHILDGLLVALQNVDEVVAGIKRSQRVEDAQQFLIQNYSLSEIQAKAILDLRLQKLASLEQEKIRNEHHDLLQKITEYKEILSSESKVLSLITEELRQLKIQYSDPRRSKITLTEEEDKDFSMEDLIEEEQVVVTLTHSGYVKRLPLTMYKTQHRGGKGVIATGMREEDMAEQMHVASTHDYFLCFTNQGQVYWLKVYQIPEAGRQASGKHLASLLEFQEQEKVTAIIPVRNFTEGYLFMVTKNGTVKKTELLEFSHPRQGGIRAISLEEKDSLVSVRFTTGNQEILIATKEGLANRFNENDVRPMGRTAYGVRGIKLVENDAVIGMVAAETGKQLLTLTENGYGKRTSIEEYRLCNRGGQGVTNIKITEKNGPVKTIMLVNGSEDLMLVSREGQGIRMQCAEIPAIGRATQGVRVMRLAEKDQLAAAAKIEVDIVQENENLETTHPSPPASSPSTQ
ncbi:DNA gyrase subunit A [Candidatus Woesearchaeota archaeon]|nr:DNA gyrase subunit A [Candidatus Woesearchaeota archaeon]